MGQLIKYMIIVNLLVGVSAFAAAGAGVAAGNPEAAGAGVSTAAASTTTAAGVETEKPQPVPRLTDRCLSQTAYVELAREWQRYIDENGPSAEALVNLGMAHDYSHEVEAAIIAGKRAVELDPDSPQALAFLGNMLSKYKDDSDEALELLERCRAVAPGYEHGLTTLAAVYLRRGELSKSEAAFKTLFDQQLIARPLQDFAYNLLIGLPEGAVLVTNGDNDTFPPLALQAGKKFRTDVVVLNRHLLALDRYREAIFERHPSLQPGSNMKKKEDGVAMSRALIQEMIDNPNITVYFAPTCPIEQLGFSPELHLEGINQKASGTGISTEASAALLLNTYRLDSATDWGYAWDLSPNLARIMSCYPNAMIRLVHDGRPDPATRARLLSEARSIAEFHEDERMLQTIKSLEKK